MFSICKLNTHNSIIQDLCSKLCSVIASKINTFDDLCFRFSVAEQIKYSPCLN